MIALVICGWVHVSWSLQRHTKSKDGRKKRHFLNLAFNGAWKVGSLRE